MQTDYGEQLSLLYLCVCMQTDYGDQLSLLYSWQEDYDRAKYYANMARDVFYQVRFSAMLIALQLCG